MSSEPFDFVNRANAEYIDQLHDQYLKDPRSVPEQWRAFFAGFEVGIERSTTDGARPTLPTGPLNMGVFDLVHSYRELGHFVAHLDPLGHDRPNHPLLDLSNFGMTHADLDREVGKGGFQGETDGTLRDLIEKLRLTYCRTIGVEFIGISDKAQRDWLIARMESILNKPQMSQEETESLMFQLIAAEEFEQYLHRAFIGAKRFSLEGAEALIPLTNALID
jgi:2-oxoglutarate dehydrogenase E1 component